MKFGRIETNGKIIWRFDSMLSGSSHISSIIERTKRRKIIQKSGGKKIIAYIGVVTKINDV